MMERSTELNRLCSLLAGAYIRHVVQKTGRPTVFVESERHNSRVTVLMEPGSMAVCIRKGLVDALCREYGLEIGEETALFLMRTSLKGEEVTKHGLTIMKDILLDGVECRLDMETGV